MILGLKSWRTYLGLASAIGLGMFGYSLSQQTVIQGQMNQTMGHVAVSLAETPPLVAETAKALKPLTATTAALDTIERKEQQTVANLATMNTQLAAIGTSEQGIVSGLDALNNATTGLTGELQSVFATNAALRSENDSAASLGGMEANQVSSLSGKTGTSIAELKRLNDKLAALSLLP